jgi:hypothetical protein
MNKSDQIDLLSKALVQAQAEMPAVSFDAVNPFFKSNYATLGAIIQATRPVLAKYGLAVSQLPVGSDGQIGIETTLMHESGQWVSTVVAVHADEKNAAQAAGSAITYLRRYSLAAILGIYSDEDDDGNGSKSQEKPKVASQTTNVPQPPLKSPLQPSKMTLDDASDVVGKDLIRYGDCTTEDLTYRFNALSKAAKQNPNDPDVARKLEAAKMLIESRKGK